MLNMIRAELYRLRHCGIFLLLAAVSSILTISLYFVIAHDTFKTADLSGHCQVMGEIGWLFMLMVVVTISGIYIGTAYNNRMAYYEVMNGYSPAKIILSKLFSLGLVFTLIAFIPSALLMFIYYLKNGAGMVENVPGAFLLLFFTILHSVVVCVLYSMLSRNIALSAFIAYIRLGIIDMVPIAVLAEYKKDALDADILCISSSGSLMAISSISSWRPLEIALLSMLVECTLVFILVYFIYKKKKFK